MTATTTELPIISADGHRYQLLTCVPDAPSAALLWLPALGVAARHYLPLAELLAQRGVAVFLHEWRGNGSSQLRAARRCNWGYRQLLNEDLAASHARLLSQLPSIPHIIGGHSLGGQLAACYLALHPQAFQRLWLVASGNPYWRSFPTPRRWTLPFFYRFAIWLARVRGVFPGRQLGFGGEEARSLIEDWARVGLSGHYAAAGLQVSLEPALARVDVPIRSALMAHDWMAPASSLRALTDKMPASPHRLRVLQTDELQTRADHFAWLKQPTAVVDALLD